MKLAPFLIILLLASCTYKKINIVSQEYKSLPGINYQDIIPFREFECWKLIYVQTFTPDSIIFSSNSSTCNEFKTSFIPTYGFNIGCLPGICFNYIQTFNNNSVNYWTTPDSLRIFLGNIDNISEALFLANGFDYYSNNESVYKTTADGYFLLMFKLVSTGMPLQTDKFLIKISRKGKIKIIGREIYRKNDHTII